MTRETIAQSTARVESHKWGCREVNTPLQCLGQRISVGHHCLDVEMKHDSRTLMTWHVLARKSIL